MEQLPSPIEIEPRPKTKKANTQAAADDMTKSAASPKVRYKRRQGKDNDAVTGKAHTTTARGDMMTVPLPMGRRLVVPP